MKDTGKSRMRLTTHPNEIARWRLWLEDGDLCHELVILGYEEFEHSDLDGDEYEFSVAVIPGRPTLLTLCIAADFN